MIYNIFLLLCALVSITYGSNAPVLIWGTTSDPEPALNAVTSHKLVEHISPTLSDSLLLVFVEKKLSSEDLSQCKTDLGTPCFGNLTNFAPYTYFISVENPVETLRSIADRKEYVVAEKGVLDHSISYKTGKVVFVSFEDGENADRNEELRNHDGVISKLWQQLSAQGKVIAVYTSLESNSLQRRIRQASTSSPSPTTTEASGNAPSNSSTNDETAGTPTSFSIKDKLLMYYTSLEYVVDSKSTPIRITGHDLKESENLYDIELTGANKENITFQIKFAGGYWSVENLKYKAESHRIISAISVPRGFSYYCGGASKFGSSNGQLVLKGLQMEAFTEKMGKNAFGDAWHCVGFTSPGIWAGLFVTFMLLGIMTIGIMWLMDVKTMDRFDDPKGKTITINAAD